MRILAIDPSLRSTGICTLNDTSLIESSHILTHDLRGMVRLGYIAHRVHSMLLVKPDLIVMEGYAMGIRGGRVFDIGELGHAIKQVLYNSGVETIIVPPTSMKKFVTGKGNAKKDQIQNSLLLDWDIDITQEDEADACGLALYGYYIKHKRMQRQLNDNKRDALKTYEILE